MALVAGAHDAARPSSSRSPPRRCAAVQAARSTFGQSATGRQRRTGPPTNSAMPDLHAKAAGPDAEDCLSIVSGRAGALGPGVKGDRCLDFLMAEDLPYHLVLARVAVKKELAYSKCRSKRIEARF